MRHYKIQSVLYPKQSGLGIVNFNSDTVVLYGPQNKPMFINLTYAPGNPLIGQNGCGVLVLIELLTLIMSVKR